MSGAGRPAGLAAMTGPAVYQGSRPLPASPGPSVALLRRFPPRPVPGGWALTSQPKPQVIARLLAPPFPTGRANLDQERRRGLTRMLDWLEAQPGESWQDRWITSGADAAGNPAWRGLLAGWLADTGRGPRDPEHVSLLAGRVIMLLVCADVIRPSLGWLLAPATPAGLSAEMARVRDPAGFAALAVIGQENCVNSHTTQLALRRIAAILAAKGGLIADITIGDCLELLQIAGNLLRSSDATSPYFYQLLRAAGIFGEAAPPGRALKTQGQLSCEQLIDRYGIECRPVRDLLVDYLRERQPAVDYPTLHKLSYVLGRLFWRDLELHQPGIASLHLPAEAAAGWKQRITTKTTRPRSARGEVTETNASRVNAFDHLVTVRAFYLDLAQWAADDPARWGPWAAPCPVRDTDIAQRGKERSRRKSRMDQRTRERIPVLPALLAKVDAGRQAAAERLAAAEATAPGQLFTAGGQTLRRPARTHASAGRTWAQDPGGGKHRDLTLEEHKAFWTWAAVQVLRHTGIRIEELREITDWRIPIYVKVGASRTYYHVALAVKAGADAIVLDGMQGGTAATQDVFIEHVGIPILAAIPQAVESLVELGMHRVVQLLLRRLPGGSRPGRDLDSGSVVGGPAGPGGRRSAPGELPADADFGSADAGPGVRQVAPAQPRARGPGGADDRGRGDGTCAAGRDELDPGPRGAALAPGPGAVGRPILALPGGLAP